MRDIASRSDIQSLVDAFYKKVVQDEAIGFIFTDVAQVDFPAHLPRMYDFWETVLLGKASFKGNPMLKHQILNNKTPLTPQHFAVWVALWSETVDENYTGAVADMAKSRAESISTLMQVKILN